MKQLCESDFDHSAYLDTFMIPANLKKRVLWATQALKTHEYDALAFMGCSGTLIASPVSYVTGKPFIMVRKTLKDCHSARIVEGYRAAKTYIIIDDFVASGQTARRIVKAIKQFSPTAKCLGVLEVNNISPKKLARKTAYPLKKPTGVCNVSVYS